MWEALTLFALLVFVVAYVLYRPFGMYRASAGKVQSRVENTKGGKPPPPPPTPETSSNSRPPDALQKECLALGNALRNRYSMDPFVLLPDADIACAQEAAKTNATKGFYTKTCFTDETKATGQSEVFADSLKAAFDSFENERTRPLPNSFRALSITGTIACGRAPAPKGAPGKFLFTVAT